MLNRNATCRKPGIKAASFDVVLKMKHVSGITLLNTSSLIWVGVPQLLRVFVFERQSAHGFVDSDEVDKKLLLDTLQTIKTADKKRVALAHRPLVHLTEVNMQNLQVCATPDVLSRVCASTSQKTGASIANSAA